MIRLEHVTVAFGRTIALDAVDATIEPGVTGVFGPNGSGKSTLLRVLAGFLHPVKGAAYLHDRPLAMPDESLRARIGFAGHASGLYARLSIRENLELFARLYGVASERVDRVVDDLALRDHADAPAGIAPAGVKRRAAVARALVHDPEMLLLDEPYANVDDEAAELTSSCIRDWHRPGRCAVIATHGAKRLKAFADAGLILQRGRVARFGTYRRTEGSP